MNYHDFLHCILDSLEASFGKNASVDCHKVLKNNNICLDGITILKDGSHISPTVYANDYYTAYQNGTPLTDIIEQITDIFRFYSLDNDYNMEWLQDFNEVRPHIAFKLINYGENLTLLSDVPHKRFLDLAVVFYLIIRDLSPEYAITLIHNEHMKSWHTDIESLYQAAYQNTFHLLGVELNAMDSIIRSFLIKDIKTQIISQTKSVQIPLTEERIHAMADEIMTELHGENTVNPMFVLTNRERYLGASCLLYPEILKSFSERYHCDFYVLPSSIHEVIFIPVHQSPAREELCAMVKEINHSEIAVSDRLSDNVYYYSYENHELTL